MEKLLQILYLAVSLTAAHAQSTDVVTAAKDLSAAHAYRTLVDICVQETLLNNASAYQNDRGGTSDTRPLWMCRRDRD